MWKSVQAKQNANFKWSTSPKKKLLDPTECIKGGCTNVVFDAQVSIVLYFNMHVTHDDEVKEQSVGTLYQRRFRNKMVLWGVWPALLLQQVLNLVLNVLKFTPRSHWSKHWIHFILQASYRWNILTIKWHFSGGQRRRKWTLFETCIWLHLWIWSEQIKIAD